VTLGRYYNWLAWFQRVTSWMGQGGGYRSLTVHRLLASSGPAIGSADVVHERILEVISPIQAPRVIDAGCGLGGTIFYLHRKLGGEYHGLTVSRRSALMPSARRGGVVSLPHAVSTCGRMTTTLAVSRLAAPIRVAIESLAIARPGPAASPTSPARCASVDCWWS
jgi:hypothetical protein